jgi:chromosome segregation ATPase
MAKKKKSSSNRVVRAGRSAKKAAAKKVKTPSKGKPALEDRVLVLSQRMTTSHREAKKALRNYKNHIIAYKVLDTYLTEERTSVSTQDSQLVGASHFSDGCNYSPMLRKIAGAYKAVQAAEKARDRAKSDLKKARGDRSDAVKKYTTAKKQLAAAKGQVTKLQKEVDKIKQGYESMEYGVAKLEEMMTWGYDKFEPALKNTKGLRALEKETRYKGKTDTVATAWLKDYITKLGTVDRMIDSTDKFTEYVKGIVNPPKPDDKGYKGKKKAAKAKKKGK